jgi:hypothetical protein
MREISATGWIVMGCFGLVIVMFYLWLWATWRHRDTSQGEWLNRFAKGLQNPWAREDSQLKELSDRVENLKHEPEESQHGAQNDE